MKALLAALILCDARWVIRYTFGVSARFPSSPKSRHSLVLRQVWRWATAGSASMAASGVVEMPRTRTSSGAPS